MAGTTRYVGGKAALAGLLAAVAQGLVGACASMQAPPGGPPDPDPPVLLAVTPDSGAELPDFDEAVEFRFDEVITEQRLEAYVTVSPRHEEVRVSWKRNGLAVEPRDGWHPNVVYIVTLLPGVTDLRNNPTDSGSMIVFSTGGPIPDTRITGSVVDWEAGRDAPRALVEAILLPDSLTYQGAADSTGDFELPFLPRGTYHMRAAVDANNNQRVDSREKYDSATVVLDAAVVTHDFWAFQHDTVGPRVTSVTRLDSLAVAIGFNQMVDSTPLAPEAITVWELPDSMPIGVDRIVSRSVFDSLQAAARAVEDSIAAVVADSIAAAVADSLAALPPDSAAPADSAVAPVPDPPDLAPTQPDTAEFPGEIPDTTRAMRMLLERPQLRSEVVVIMTTPLRPGTRYWVEASVANLLGALLQSGRFLVLPAAEPDST